MAADLNITEADINVFYDTNVKTSFGSLIANVTGGSSEWFKCSDSANCTSIELANLQWGSGSITLNPGQYDKASSSVVNNLTPSTPSMASWGLYPVPKMEKSPEFSFYTSADYANL